MVGGVFLDRELVDGCFHTMFEVWIHHVKAWKDQLAILGRLDARFGYVKVKVVGLYSALNMVQQMIRSTRGDSTSNGVHPHK